MQFAVFSVFLCGFAVFGPPLRPPPNELYPYKHQVAGVVKQPTPVAILVQVILNTDIAWTQQFFLGNSVQEGKVH